MKNEENIQHESLVIHDRWFQLANMPCTECKKDAYFVKESSVDNNIIETKIFHEKWCKQLPVYLHRILSDKTKRLVNEWASDHLMIINKGDSDKYAEGWNDCIYEIIKYLS